MANAVYDNIITFKFIYYLQFSNIRTPQISSSRLFHLSRFYGYGAFVAPGVFSVVEYIGNLPVGEVILGGHRVVVSCSVYGYFAALPLQNYVDQCFSGIFHIIGIG